MWQLLFKDPDDELEREDEWGEPKGFLIGGWASYSKREIAQQYFDAANILVEVIRRNQWEDYKLAFPVLYLYRHALELMLKAFVNSRTRTHDIGDLISDVEALVEAHYRQPLPAWIRTWLSEIALRDPNSTTYRYGEVYDKASKSFGPVPGEEHVELRNLQAAMDATYTVLDHLLNEIRLAERH